MEDNFKNVFMELEEKWRRPIFLASLWMNQYGILKTLINRSNKDKIIKMICNSLWIYWIIYKSKGKYVEDKYQMHAKLIQFSQIILRLKNSKFVVEEQIRGKIFVGQNSIYWLLILTLKSDFIFDESMKIQQIVFIIFK